MNTITNEHKQDRWGWWRVRETTTGYRRSHDNFFISTMTLYDHEKRYKTHMDRHCENPKTRTRLRESSHAWNHVMKIKKCTGQTRMMAMLCTKHGSAVTGCHT